MRTFWYRLLWLFLWVSMAGLFLAAGGRPAAAGMLTMETPHFHIHFPDTPQAKEIAAKAAAIADAGFSMKAENWLRLVLTHEYAHILHLDMNGGITAGIRRVFGRVPYFTTPNLFLPPAHIEGFAVREETLNTGGGRGADPYYDMFLRTAVLTETVPAFDQMLGLYEEWRRDLEERYRAQTAELEKAGLTPVEELTGPIMAASPVFSPDGTALAYITLGKKDFYPGLYLRDLRSGEDRLLVAGDISSRPAWSPSGRQLVYAKPGYLEGEKLYNDLYLYDLDRQEERRLTRGARATDPAWSPSGDYLVYVARDNLETSLCQYDLAAGGAP